MGPLLFCTYLDHLLKKCEVNLSRVIAFGDEVLMRFESLEELHQTLKKLRKIQPYLKLNLAKSGIIQLKGESLYE